MAHVDKSWDHQQLRAASLDPGEAHVWYVDTDTAGWPIDKSIVHVQLELMSRYPDSLIARKCGVTRAEESASRAAIVLASGPAGSLDYVQSLNGFDAWLRSDGNRRNPGTTADLIAAGLFVALRDGLIKQPLKWD